MENKYKIIIGFLILFFFNNIALTQNITKYKIKLKNWKEEEILDVVSLSKEKIVYLKNNKNIEVKLEDLEYAKTIGSGENTLKRVIIVTQPKGTYYTGQIVYQDRNKISIEVLGDLKNINISNILNIIEEEEFIKESTKSKWKALIWSSLYPGMGQLYTYDRNFAGITFATLFTAGAIGSWYTWSESQKYYQRYQDSRYKEEEHYNKYNNYYQLTNICIALTVIIYIGNIIDVLINFDSKYGIQINEEEYFKKFNNKEKSILLQFNNYQYAKGIMENYVWIGTEYKINL